MATITTSSQAQVFNFSPACSMVNRVNTDAGVANGYTGDMFALVRTGTNDYSVYVTENEGTSWLSPLITMTRANIQEFASLHLNADGFLHLAYRTYESGQDRIYFRRCNVTTSPSIGTEFLLAAQSAASAGLSYQGLDIQTARSGLNHYIVVAAGYTSGGQQGVVMVGGSIDASSNWHANNGVIASKRLWLETGTGRIQPILDIEHNGDMVSASPANLWCGWNGLNRANPRALKLAWNGSGWTGPANPTNFNTVAAQDWVTSRWTGSEWVMAGVSASDGTKVSLWERNKANTTTTYRAPSNAHPTGVIRAMTASYKHTSRDIRVYAVGTSTAVVYSCDWVRATDTWTSWTSVHATAVIGTSPAFQFSSRRSTYGNGKMDVILGQATPIQIGVHQSLAYTPNTPTWEFGTGATTPPANGAAMDTAASLTLDWAYSHPDPAQTQASYQLQRQVGALALEWWNAGSAIWQAGAVDNATGTSAVTLTATQAWSDGNATNASDPNHVYKVRVKDASGQQSALSDSLTIIPSAKVNPTVTAPTAASTATSSSVSVTWTVAQQSAYQLKIRLTSAGSFLWDSGKLTSAAVSVPVGIPLADGGDYTVELTTWNSEGLASTVQTRQFFVAYIVPPAPTMTVTPVPAEGVIRIVLTNPAPGGGQPAFGSQDLYRRALTAPLLNTNPYFETVVTPWTVGTATSMVRSTAQAHTGAASGLLTPNGSAGTAIALDADVLGIVVGAAYRATVWVRCAAARSVNLNIVWKDAGGSTLSTSTQAMSVAITTWTQITLNATAPASAARAQVTVSMGSTPAAGHLLHIDEAELRVANDDLGTPVTTGLASGATYDDWAAWSRQPFEYRSVVFGDNGAFVRGAWTA